MKITQNGDDSLPKGTVRKLMFTRFNMYSHESPASMHRSTQSIIVAWAYQSDPTLKRNISVSSEASLDGGKLLPQVYLK